MRIGEITGLTWEDVIIDEEAIANNNAKVIINKELSRINAEAMQKLKEKDVIKIFPTQKPHCTTRLVLKTPKTETSNRTVWLPKTVAKLLVQYKKDQQEMKEFVHLGPVVGRVGALHANSEHTVLQTRNGAGVRAGQGRPLWV